ncbi:hypothetical protein BpHYR1_047516 [Brachionus plicatilis]|uniref:Uncharacterized protein n=1 Tax=Brachionus plicatilis TaxID=10195 RepID=A0A3M7SPE4_BRAPC|nr:hypothetical protein BpHYR1_047516 [Brachionus plicatilis]
MFVFEHINGADDSSIIDLFDTINTYFGEKENIQKSLSSAVPNGAAFFLALIVAEVFVKQKRNELSFKKKFEKNINPEWTFLNLLKN